VTCLYFQQHPPIKDASSRLKGGVHYLSTRGHFFLIPKDGTVYPVKIVLDGKAVSRLAMAPSLAQTVVPSLSINIWGNHVLAGSCVWPSVLLKVAHVEMEVEKIDVALTVVVQDDNQMDYDDEDEGLCLFFGYCGPY